ncbi:MAG: MarR family winged helix-turn-helix transcriptional regulator [Oscillospiraceae bacterium]
MDYTQSAKELLSAIWTLRHVIRNHYLNEEFKGENVALLYLLEHGASTPGEISRALGVTTPRVTALINSLEVKKYVLRTHSLKDRRMAEVALTQDGHAAIEAVLGEIVSRTRQLLEQLGEEDAQAYLRIMKKLAGGCTD